MTFIARKQTGDMGFVWIEAGDLHAAQGHCWALGYHLLGVSSISLNTHLMSCQT